MTTITPRTTDFVRTHALTLVGQDVQVHVGFTSSFTSPAYSLYGTLEVVGSATLALATDDGRRVIPLVSVRSIGAAPRHSYTLEYGPQS